MISDPNLAQARYGLVCADWRSDFPDAIAQIEEIQSDATARRARLTLAETPLSIGVMGQVKAGKSSFLNSLLFGGRALLPEAATPKTANLTRIRYAAKPSFTARFYRPQDWAVIERQAAGDSPDETSRTARELVAAARASGADVSKLLAQGEITLAADDIGGLLGALNDYVGGDGRLTALVAETELALPLEELIGIEIVDTPGMNDPVVSRTDKTRQYMAQCDVVFFLSRCSQFLDSNDQTLMALQLPQKGIKRLILVGAQFDMAILDDGFNRESLAACRTRLVDRLSNHAQTIFTNLAEQRAKQGFAQTAELLRCVGAPIFASTHAWMISNPVTQQWNDGVRHTHQEMTELARDVWRTELQTSDWAQLANMQPLTSALHQARSDKEALLEQQRTGLESELAAVQADQLRQLRELAEGRMHALQRNDLASLTDRERTEQAQLDKVSRALSDFLRGTAAQTESRCRQLINEINATAARASRVDERTGYKRSSSSVSVSDSIWYKPWTWFSSHEESYSETRTYTYLAVSDAVENLRYYVQTARRKMLSAFDDLIAPSTLSAGLRRELLRAIDPSRPDFDPQGLRALVESSLGNLKLPELNFETPDVDEAFSGFSGEVKHHGDMQRLREKLGAEVGNLNAMLVNRLSTTVHEASQTLEGIATHLHGMLTARLAKELQRLRDAMADKENQIARMQSLIKAIDTV